MMKDKVWNKIYEYLLDFRSTRKVYIKNEESCRKFVEAVFWIVRSGSQWKMLPEKYGKWSGVWKRFSEWSDKGIWYKMFYYFQQDPDMEYIMVDSTMLRAHACATPKKIVKRKNG